MPTNQTDPQIELLASEIFNVIQNLSQGLNDGFVYEVDANGEQVLDSNNLPAKIKVEVGISRVLSGYLSDATVAYKTSNSGTSAADIERFVTKKVSDARTALETALDTAIANLVDSSPDELNTLKEIVDYVKSNDVLGKILANETAITTLRTEFDSHVESYNYFSELNSQAHGELEASISNLSSTTAAADGVLQANITAEESARVAADGILQTNITAEESARVTADGVLEGKIAAETSARTSADGVLEGKITVEASIRTSADGVLQANITAEESARVAADGILQTNITAEESARVTADGVLEGKIAAETSARTSADGVLQGNIDVEASARTSADTTLNTKIDNFIAKIGSEQDFKDATSKIKNINFKSIFKQ